MIFNVGMKKMTKLSELRLRNGVTRETLNIVQQNCKPSFESIKIKVAAIVAFFTYFLVRTSSCSFWESHS